MKVYLVWKGEYSDADVYGVFSSEDSAKDFSNLIGGRYIEDVELDEIPPEYAAPKGKRPYEVVLKRNGDVVEINPPESMFSSQENFELARQGKSKLGSSMFDRDGKYFITFVFAKDKKQAIKIANDRRRQFIAEGKWK
jgi:hypothetical protein